MFFKHNYYIIVLNFQKEDIDLRLEFLSEYILRSLKQKIDKWSKFITGEERVR